MNPTAPSLPKPFADARDAVNGVYRNPTAVLDRYVYTPLFGDYLFDHEWDLAVVLDACRYDLGVRRGSSHSVGLGTPERAVSVGSHSPDWIERTFRRATDDQLARTAYVSANPWTNRVPESKLARLDRVYRYAWDDDVGTVRPRPVTDRTITLVREGAADRYVVHYMQPHLPPLRSSGPDYGWWSPSEGSNRDLPASKQIGWEVARSGLAPDAAIADYERNLDPVLDDLAVLLENVAAGTVVVTADHGNYLGERGRWGHPGGHVHPAVRHVPWWETTATDEETHQPDSYDRTAVADRSAQLEALGYR